MKETDHACLASRFEALSCRTRLAILAQIRTPKALKEIRLPPGGFAGDRPRLVARQTVRRHLDVLIREGLVSRRQGEREWGPTTEYVLEPHALRVAASDVAGYLDGLARRVEGHETKA